MGDRRGDKVPFAVTTALPRPDIGQLQTALNNAGPRPVTPRYTEFSRVFRQGIARALNNNGKLEDNFAQELAAILNRR